MPAPRSLVPFLDFARLPERAVARFRRVLDDDEELRRATREATDEDIVGRASWLFLERPDGWQEELGQLAEAAEDQAEESRDRKVHAELRRQLEAQTAARQRAETESVQLAAEVRELKDEFRAERRARRRIESDAGRLRRRTEELEATVEELRQAEAELRQGQGETAAADSGGNTPPDSGGNAGEDTGGTVGPGGRPSARAPDGGGNGPRTVEADAPALDRRALAAALRRAMGAADVLGEALAESAGLVGDVVGAAHGASPPTSTADGTSGSDGRHRIEPARSPRRRPHPLPPGTFDDSVAAAEHLVRAAQVLVLVDGYNVTKLARPELSLAEQRSWLVDAAVELAARSGAQLELIFDGAGERGSAPADLGRRMGVQVRFSSEGVEADDLLLELAAATPPVRPVVVATDDRRVRDGARGEGANVISSPQLLAVLRRPV